MVETKAVEEFITESTQAQSIQLTMRYPTQTKTPAIDTLETGMIQINSITGEPMIFVLESVLPSGLKRGFWIDQNVVSCKSYQRCIDKESCSSLTACLAHMNDSSPAVGLSWYQADEFCSWAGMSLLTLDAWKTSSEQFTQHINQELTADNEAGTQLEFEPGKQFVNGLIGNTWQWLDNDDQTASDSDSSQQYQKSEHSYKLIAGGSLSSSRMDIFLRDIGRLLPEETSDDVGFRCMIPVFSN